MTKKPKNGSDDRKHNEDLADRDNQALFYHHKRRYRAALAEKKAADADFKNQCKRAVGDLGDGVIADIRESIEWEKKGGEGMVRAAMLRLQRLARWMGFTTGVQGELFADAPKDETPTPHQRGFIAGMDGAEPSSPFDPGSQEAGEWMDGWHEGNQRVNDIIKMKDSDEFDEDAGGGDDAGEAGEGEGAPPPIGDDESTAQAQH